MRGDRHYKQVMKAIERRPMPRYPTALAELVKGSRTSRNRTTQVYFLRRLPRDPFAADDVKAEDTWGLRAYASPPDDPREGADVFDVYSLAEGAGLNGVPYKEW